MTREVDADADVDRARATTTTTTTTTTRCDTLAERVVRTQFGVVMDKVDDARGARAQGEATLMALAHAFALVGWFGYGRVSPSLCGYAEVVPNGVAMLYYTSAAGTARSALWGAMMGARAESVRALKAARALAGAVPALALVGLSVFPRCMFAPHQGFVEIWAHATAVAMLFELAVDSRYVSRRFRGGATAVSSDQALAQITYLLGYFIMGKYYAIGGNDFYRGEVVGCASYGWWVVSKHRAGTFPNQTAARTYTWRELFVEDGFIGLLCLAAYRYNQYSHCDAFGQF